MGQKEAYIESYSARSPARIAVSELNVVHRSAPYRRPELRNTLPINIPQLSHSTDSCRLNSGEIAPQESNGNIFYLGYGSNLSSATFLGARGIRPLSKVNVVVPALRLTFDLAGFPYNEPCFANSAKRDVGKKACDQDITTTSSPTDKTPLLQIAQNPLNWNKGLVGVLYEVTPADYAHIIATEGGGTSYDDIIVDCYALSNDPTLPVPTDFTGQAPIKAHTLFAPAEPSPPSNHSTSPPKCASHIMRPHRDYAQPSPRYLNLITSGAAENGLPNEYRAYLNSLHAYTITTTRQRFGQYVFTVTWGPIIFGLTKLASAVGDGNGTGQWPAWAAKMVQLVFASVWWSYDNFWRDRFGDGERTEGDEYEDGDEGDGRGAMGKKGAREKRAVDGGGGYGYGSLLGSTIDEKSGWDMV